MKSALVLGSLTMVLTACDLIPPVKDPPAAPPCEHAIDVHGSVDSIALSASGYVASTHWFNDSTDERVLNALDREMCRASH